MPLLTRRRDLTANIRTQIQQLREAEEAEKDAVPSYGQTVRHAQWLTLPPKVCSWMLGNLCLVSLGRFFRLSAS